MKTTHIEETNCFNSKRSSPTEENVSFENHVLTGNSIHNFSKSDLMTLRQAFIYTISVFSLITLVSYLIFR
jgi:hypothetical protein